jgi:hypothetical protein
MTVLAKLLQSATNVVVGRVGAIEEPQQNSRIDEVLHQA